MKSFREQFKLDRHCVNLKFFFKAKPHKVKLLETAIKLVFLASLKTLSVNVKITKILKKK